MKRFTFLGCGKNALSMFVEILVSIYGNEFNIEIVKNMDVKDDTLFMPNHIEYKELMFNEFDFSNTSHFLFVILLHTYLSLYI